MSSPVAGLIRTICPVPVVQRLPSGPVVMSMPLGTLNSEITPVVGYLENRAYDAIEALHKLEQQGWIQSEWKPTENNRRAKFYSLTRLGKRHLKREAANWERISTAISDVVRLEEA